MTRPEIMCEVTYPASLERVWAALTDPAALARWLLPNDFAPQLGHRFSFQAASPSDSPLDVQCQVVALEAPHRLAFTWREDARRRPTLVTFTLEEVARGTRLRLEHSGFLEAERASARHRLQRQWRRLPLLLQVQVDSTALTDELLAFVREPRALTRNALPLLAELRQVPELGVPLELAEAMVLDGVEQRAFVAEIVAAALDRPGYVDRGALGR